ncbi:hypothetical protein ACHAW6_008528 [Cyclotella cf. meneghiniana]
MSNYLKIYYIASMKMALPLSHLNVNGPSKKLTGWVIGLLHGMPSSRWIVLGMPLNYACSLAALTTIEICGQVMPTSLNPRPPTQG